jgi:xylan 1,4-beta-xylosidase
MEKRLVWRVCIVFSLVAVAIAAIDASSATYVITVDASNSLGPWNRFYEECVGTCHPITVLTSSYGRNIQAALRRGHAECGFRKIRSQAIFTDGNVYSESNGLSDYNWAMVDQIYDSVKALGYSGIVTLNFIPTALALGTQTCFWYNGKPGNVTPPKDYTKWQNLVTALVQHMEQRYGAEEIRKNWSFEVWNEPDQAYFWSGTQTDYLKLYDYAAEGVRLADSLCKIGGPATSGCNPTWIDQFTSHVVSGISYATGLTGVKCDFVNYHRYSDDPSYASIPTAISYPMGMNNYHRAVDSLLKKNNFKGEIKCTEWAGTAATRSSHADDESSGSFIAKTIHLLSDNDATQYPMPTAYSFWCISDIFEEWNAGTTCSFYSGYGLLVRGDKNIPDSWDVPKPSYNTFRLLHKLTDARVSLAGGTTGDGIGGVATLSSDNSSLQILLYNHVDGAQANSASSDSVELTVDNIPFAPGDIKVEYWLIDRTHSNGYRVWQNLGSSTTPSATQWTQIKAAAELSYAEPAVTTTLSGKTFTKKFHSNIYSVGLINLSRAATTAIYKPAKAKRSTSPSISIGSDYIIVATPITRCEVLKLFDVQGKLALTVNNAGHGYFRIDRSSLRAGAYVLADDNGALPLARPLIIAR